VVFNPCVPIVPQVEHWIKSSAYAPSRDLCYFNKNYWFYLCSYRNFSLCCVGFVDQQIFV